MKPEFSHVRNILINTISLLCKNSLTYQQGLRIHGLLGITLDDEVFLVEISEHFLQKNPESSVIVPAAGVKLEQDCDLVAEDISDNPSKTKRKHKRTLKTTNESVEESSNSAVQSSTTGSHDGVVTFFEPGVAVISIKEESTEEDVLKNFILDSSGISQPDLNLVDQHLSEQCINYSDSTAFTDTASDPKAEEDVVEILSDDLNQTVWNVDSFANSSDGHGWLETPQNRLSAGLTSRATATEQKSRTQRHSSTGDSRSPMVPDSVPLQRWSMTWSTSRRPAASAHKQFRCDIEGCTRSYYAKKNLLRHQTTLHGRVPMYRRPIINRSPFYQGTSY